MSTHQKKEPVYRQIYRTLLAELDQGLYEESGMLPSEKELCGRFDVERNTLRKALSLLVDDGRIIRRPGLGTELVKPESDKNENRAGPISLLLAQADYLQSIHQESYHLKLIQSLDKRLASLGRGMLFKPVEQNGDITELIRGVTPETIIFDSLMEPKFYSQALQADIPCISINHSTACMTSVVSDNFGGAYDVVKRLLDAGHRNIVFILGNTTFYSCQERLRGIRQIYTERKLSLNEKQLINGDWRFSSGAAAADSILKSNKADRPTAVFAFNDDMAYGCYSALTKGGLAVPDDISIVGFNNNDRYADMFPPISTVDEKLSAIVEYATWYIVESYTGRAPKHIARIEIQTEFCDKGTIKAL